MLLSTPAGRRERFHEVWQSDNPAWQRIRVTTEECSYIHPSFLEKERRTLGPDMFAQEYACKFLHGVGNLFSDEALADMLIGGNLSIVRRWMPPKADLIVSAAG